MPGMNWSYTGLSIVVAYLLALPIGLEWERLHHGVGLRTFPLVGVACCAYVLVGRHFLGAGAQNLDRIIQGLMTGIGFIGGGAIFRERDTIYGAATAASIWGTGALGAAVATGAYDVAIMLAVVNWATAHFLRPHDAVGGERS
jgi:putative Mg2+ transporter-C (MgtC) family protein